MFSSKSLMTLALLKGYIEANGGSSAAYDDSELRALIQQNTEAIATLTGTGEGSIAAIAAMEVAKIVADADANFDTLKEIADWITNDTTGAAAMANDIAVLQTLVGDTNVATQINNSISNALTIDGVDKYALATELQSLVERVSAIEAVLTAERLLAWDNAEQNAKDYADSLYQQTSENMTTEITQAVENAVAEALFIGTF